MDFSLKMTLKTLILRHRSVAVLIRRGHLNDARLLLIQLVEDIIALAGRMGKSQLTEKLSIRAGLLQEPIAPGSLAQDDVRRLRSVNSLCLHHTRALAALVAPASGSIRRFFVIFSASLLSICTIAWGGASYLQTQKRETALKNLNFLAQVAYIAKIKTNKTLVEITGNSCSECPCRGGKDMRALMGDVCQANWVAALAAIWHAASGESPFNVQGGIILEKRLLRDPWGSPYALNEEEGEGPGACAPDMLRSVGPDGILNTSDDIVVSVQTLCTQTP